VRAGRSCSSAAFQHSASFQRSVVLPVPVDLGRNGGPKATSGRLPCERQPLAAHPIVTVL
jgi:hypothetical protein